MLFGTITISMHTVQQNLTFKKEKVRETVEKVCILHDVEYHQNQTIMTDQLTAAPTS